MNISARTEPAKPAAARLMVLWERPAEPDAFEQHYREVHIPIARELPGLRSYTLTHDVSAVRGTQYYLVAELTWDTLEELHAAFASPAGRATAADTAELQQYATVRSMILSTGAGVALPGAD